MMILYQNRSKFLGISKSEIKPGLIKNEKVYSKYNKVLIDFLLILSPLMWVLYLTTCKNLKDARCKSVGLCALSCLIVSTHYFISAFQILVRILKDARCKSVGLCALSCLIVSTHYFISAFQILVRILKDARCKSVGL